MQALGSWKQMVLADAMPGFAASKQLDAQSRIVSEERPPKISNAFSGMRVRSRSQTRGQHGQPEYRPDMANSDSEGGMWIVYEDFPIFFIVRLKTFGVIAKYVRYGHHLEGSIGHEAVLVGASSYFHIILKSS